jgi:hypothetical protein
MSRARSCMSTAAWPKSNQTIGNFISYARARLDIETPALNRGLCFQKRFLT